MVDTLKLMYGKWFRLLIQDLYSPLVDEAMGNQLEIE